MINNLEIKRNIFDLFDNTRVLFNDYYNGFNHDYTEEDIEKIKTLLSSIQEDIDNIKGEM